MKVLHILAQLPRATGSGIYFTNLIKQMERYGHDQAAVCALQDDCAFTGLPPNRLYPVKFKTDELPFPVPGMSDVMPYDSTRYGDMSPEALSLWTRAFRATLTRAAEDFRPDVVIPHHLWMLTSLAVELFPEAKSIGVCHYTDLRQAMLNPDLKERYVTNIHKLDMILSLCETHQDDICRIHSSELTRVMPMGGGFDGDLFYPSPKKFAGGPVKILYAGKIDPSKGVFALIEAFISLKKDVDLSLSLVGTPRREHADRLNMLARENSGIQMYPAQPQDQLARIMREHHIFAMPSFFEGLGLIALEALACGLWTVSTEIEGLISLLGERVIQSGVIEFVALPTMTAPGIPHDSQLAKFTADLEAKLLQQVTRVRRGKGFPADIQVDIARHSWEAMASRIQMVINN